MRKRMRKALCVLLACCMALTWCAPALAAVLEDDKAELQAADTDRCGPNARWSLDEETGTLTISGTGDMTDYRYSGNRYDSGYGAPWSEQAYNISRIDIDDGITSIGAAAFVGCSVTEVSIPASVKRIGAQAFRECYMQSVNIPDGVESIGDNAFRSSGLKSLTIPVSVTSIGKGAFLDCSLVYVDYQGTSAQWDAVRKGSQIFNAEGGVQPYIRCLDDKSENPSGTCGEDITWEYYSNGCLVLRGTGNIPDFASADEAPWKDYRDSLQYVIIDIAANNGGDSTPYLERETDEAAGTVSVILVQGDERTVVATGKIDGSELELETNDEGYWIFTDTDGKSVTYNELQERFDSETYLDWEQDDEAGVFSVFATSKRSDERTVIATGKLVDEMGPETNKDGEEIFTDTDGRLVTYSELAERIPDSESSFSFEAADGVLSVMLVTGDGESTLVATAKIDGSVRFSRDMEFTDTDGKPVTLIELQERYLTYMEMQSNYKDGTSSVAFVHNGERTVVATGKLVKTGEKAPETDDDGEWLLTGTDGKPVSYSELEERYNPGYLSIGTDEDKGTSAVTLEKGGESTVVATGKLVSVPTVEKSPSGDELFTGADGHKITYRDLEELYLYSRYADKDEWDNRDGRIGNYAFYGCKQLRNVAFSDGSYEWNLGAIGDYAFAYCESLQYPVGSSVRTVGDYAFAYCESLQSPISGPVETIGDSAFRGCKGFTNSWLWIDAVTIGDSAFRDCVTLEWVWNLPSTTSIGDYAFAGCANLTKADLSDQMISIGDYAFSGCPLLSELELSESLESVGAHAFSDCLMLQSAYYHGTQEQWESVQLGEDAFSANVKIQCSDSGSEDGPPDDPGYEPGENPNGSCGENLTWELISDKLYIRGSGKMTDYELDVDDYYPENNPWTEHEWNIYYVVVEEGVESIGNYAFRGCSNIHALILPESLTEIGEGAFSSPSGYGYDRFGNTVESSGASSVSGIYYAGTDAQWNRVNLQDESIENVPCYASDTRTCGDNLSWDLDFAEGKLFIRGAGKMNDYETGDPSISSVSSSAPWSLFAAFFTRIVIEDGVTSIGDYAFSGLYVSSSFESSYSFVDEDGKDVLDVNGDGVIDGKDDVNGDGIIDAMDVRAAGGRSGRGRASEMREVEEIISEPMVIPDSVESIGVGAFMDCGSLEILDIPPKVTAIAASTFANSGLRRVSLPDGVESIGESAFMGCSLETIDIPSKVTAIAASAFANCSSLMSVAMPSATSIGAHAFENCSSLTSVSMPGVTSIGEYAFSSCPLGRGEEYIDENGVTYGYQTGDNPLILPAALVSIGDHAFEGCTGITAVTLPAPLTRLGASAFKDCAKLKSVRVPGGVTNLGASAFANCAEMTSAVLGNGVKTITNGLFSGCASLDNVYIPASVTTVQRNAFNGCTALYQVNFGGSETEWKAVEIATGNEPLESENLTVACNVAQTNEVASLEISGMDNVIVTLGMPLDISNMIVTAVDANGGRQTVTGYSVYGFNSGRLGTQSIGVKYLTEETSFDITVVEPYVTEISVSVQPVRRSYTQGEELDLRGLTLEAKYSDNSTQYVTEGFEASGYDKNKVGTQTITISYEGKETALTVEVIAPRPNVAPPKISVTAYPGGKTISLTSETQGASLYYTTDGGNPAESGKPYSEPFTLTASATVKVCAVLGDASSDVTSVPITVEQVAAVTADKSGAMDAGTSVTLETATPGAAIWYGPDAEHMTQLYKGGIVVDKNMEIYAVARKDGWRDSEIFHASYAANAGTATNEVNVSLGNSDSRAGDNCAMPVYLFSAGDRDVTSFQISIAYDASTFAYDSISPAEGVQNLFLNAERGRVTVQYNILQSEAEARLPGGEVFTLNFKTLDSAEDGAFRVTVDGQPLVRVDGSDEAAQTRNQDGVITLKGSHNSQLTVQSAVLTDSDGNSVSVSESQSVSNAARMNVTLDPDAKQGDLDTILNVIQILYDSEHKMVSMQVWETNLTLTGFIFSQGIDIPADKDVAYVKLFILTDDLSPTIPSLLM